MRSSVTTTLGLLATLVTVGTTYSVYYNTYLDTSDPTITHLPHHLHATHYFASKANPLNTLFLKRLWLWTSAAFLGLFLTSPPAARIKERLYQYAGATAVWALFTSWFFGPALLDRVTGLTGGECVVSLPSGYVVRVPNEYCQSASAVSPATHPGLFAASLLVPDAGNWSAHPRLRRGHDVSGHIFIVTLSALFLVDQLAKTRSPRAGAWPDSHRWAVLSTWAVVALELFASYVTSVYFHSPQEKLTGFLLGLAGFYVTQLPFFQTHTPMNLNMQPTVTSVVSEARGQPEKRATL